MDTLDKNNSNNLVPHTTSSYEIDILKDYACLGQLNILTFRRVFLLLTRQFFADPLNFNVAIQQDWLRNMAKYTYSDPVIDPEHKHDCTVDVKLDYLYGDNVSRMEYIGEGQNPAIIITVSDVSYEPIHSLDTTSAYTKDRSGCIQTYNSACLIKFTVYAKSFADTAILSQLVSSHFIGLRPYIINQLNLQEYTPQGLTSPVCINSEEANKTFRAEFAVKLSFENRYKSRLASCRIKTITTQLVGKSSLDKSNEDKDLTYFV
jgi:hypothetical protein